MVAYSRITRQLQVQNLLVRNRCMRDFLVWMPVDSIMFRWACKKKKKEPMFRDRCEYSSAN